MESTQIEQLLNKYLEGKTSIVEERELKDYFTSNNVASHLQPYKSMFGYFKNQEEVQFTKTLPLQPRKRNVVKWIGVAASFVVLFGTSLFYINSNGTKEDLGTYDDPEVAFIETQKALEMLSVNVNYGVESVALLNEYDQSKKTIFK
ncbi:hypothetical protein [Flavobacterium sp.]|jgi:hypothetical protein|uniref:hypothetical protein n=1 Tax=Flavobacterium sp. TaxID=239 RepID=UPI002A82E75C|nr:hypothetical protein [Flavobacterium sp.]